MKSREAISQLIKTSELKLNVLYELYELTKKQRKDIENKDDEYLLYTIEKKQEKIEEINELDKNFYITFLDLKKDLAIDSIDEIDIEKYDNVKLLKEVVRSILEVTQNIQKIDKLNVEDVSRELEVVKGEMKNLKSSVRATKSYGNMYNHSQGVFIDNKK